MRLIIACVAMLTALPALHGQAVTFTGNANTDFPASQHIADPGGLDVGLIPTLSMNTSGWDIDTIAMSYDEPSDTMFVGINTYGIMGDADGDGDPSVTSPQLTTAGGVDEVDLANTESVAFSLDLDDDGTLDIICGIPFGSDVNGFTVADFSGTIFAPALSFGATRPLNIGTLHASPSAAAPHFEFTIPNFSALTAEFMSPGQTAIGIHVFAGSLSDAGIGEDFLPGTFTQSVPITLFPCLPIPNDFQLLAVNQSPTGGGFDLLTQVGVYDGYGCCFLYSFLHNPGISPLNFLPGQPVIDIGTYHLAGIGAFDPGVPAPTGHTLNCKQSILQVPAAIPSGTNIYFQVFTYPGGLGTTMNYYTTNVVTYTQP